MKLFDCQLPPAVLEKNESGPDDAVFRIDLQEFIAVPKFEICD